MKSLAVFAAMALVAVGCQAGWLRPGQPGFIIQTFTSYAPISGNNTGSITTNGNSYQFAGDNSGTVYIGGPGTQFRGKNDGALTVDGDGAFVMGSFAALSAVTNHGKGALILGNLSAGQKAMVTDIGHGALLIGAGTVSNAQAIVVGDGNVSHGARSVTADSVWGMGSGFHGNGAGLTNVTELSAELKASLTNPLSASIAGHGPRIAALELLLPGTSTDVFSSVVSRGGNSTTNRINVGGLGLARWGVVGITTVQQVQVTGTLNPDATGFYTNNGSYNGFSQYAHSTNGIVWLIRKASSWKIVNQDDLAFWIAPSPATPLYWSYSPVGGVSTGVATVASYTDLLITNYDYVYDCVLKIEGTQLVFTAGTVTNVLDGDIGSP